MGKGRASTGEIVEAFCDLRSVSAVANKLHVSEIKVRRTLITEGMWSSRTSRQIAALLESGVSVQEIATRLSITPKAVEAYMPYRRGAYHEREPSASSERSEAYRQRKETALKNQIHYSGNSLNKIASRKETKDSPNPTAHQLYMSIMEKPPKIMRLHLELIGIGDQEIQLLRTYGRVKDTVFRNILVPAEIPLHALHYCIQRAFGWQNSHPHHFEYPDPIQRKLLNAVSKSTNSSLLYQSWEKLCGIYYRFPTQHEKDIYWDDDYDGSESIKSWFRRKYTEPFPGAYYYDGFLEHYLECKSSAMYFRKSTPAIPMLPSSEECPARIKAGKPQVQESILIDAASVEAVGQYLQHNLFELLERVPLINFVFPRGVSLPNDLREQIMNLSETASNELQKNKAEIRKHQLAITKAVNQFSKDTTAGVAAYCRAYKAYKKIATSCDPEPIPLSDTLFYEYGSGDRWKVQITCEEVYLTKDGWDYPDAYGYVSAPITKEQILITTEAYDRDNKPVDETLRQQIAKVIANSRPVCISSDGLSVMDDVGGVSGYCRFLSGIHEGSEEERNTLLAWAKGRGWTGRRQAPENIL